MHPYYPNLLSPYKIGDIVLRNRMIVSPNNMHYIQGPEPFPSEGTIMNYANRAKGGAALVTVKTLNPAFSAYKKTERRADGGIEFDIFDARNQHYVAQLVESIHFYGAKASMLLVPSVPPEFECSDGVASIEVAGTGGISKVGREIPEDEMMKIIEQYRLQAEIAKICGFDGVFLHMAYRLMLPAKFLSPLSNKRTDKYGGPIENRARFPLMIAEAIKKECGQNFIIEAAITGEDPKGMGGFTLDDACSFAKLAEGKIDLLQMRSPDIETAHTTGYCPEETPFEYMAEAVKDSGARIGVSTVSGYLDPAHMEEVIASGKADLIAMARGWIANAGTYGKKVYEHRPQDIVPCLRCNKCLATSSASPDIDVCSVNPEWGLEHKLDKLIVPVESKKKVAVIGGGPAGMEAAIVCADRGHDVVLFEKDGVLGGALNHCDGVSFKWPLKKFRDYMRYQVSKRNVDIRLNTEATIELLKKEGFDAIITAIGATPVRPPIPGADGENIRFAAYIYGHEDELDKEVVIIGGGEIGVETGIHLAQKGHHVTVVEMLDDIAKDTAPMHFRVMVQEVWEKQEGFEYVVNARCTGITEKGVTYIDKAGTEHFIEAGSVILAAGMKPRTDEAFAISQEFQNNFIVGDCLKGGSVQTAMRSAWSISNTI